MVKLCKKCSLEKPFSEFHKHQKSKDGFYYRCKACAREDARLSYDRGGRERNEARKSEIKEIRRQYLYQLKYGITLERYNELLTTQQGVCAICSQCCSTGNELCVDHCHTTGEVRGLLCSPCNLGLGYFRDAPKRLESAIEYLKLHGVERYVPAP